MRIVIAYLDIKKECIEDFKKITVYNHENSIQEAGNVRFDVLQNREDETKFTLYEIWKDDAAFDFHKSTPHYNKWNETVADYVTKPRSRDVYTEVALTDK